MQSSTNSITKAELQAFLNIFDQKKSWRSRFFDHKEVRKCREFIAALNSEILSEVEMNQLGLLGLYYQ